MQAVGKTKSGSDPSGANTEGSRTERGLSSPQQRKKMRVTEFFEPVERSRVAADWKVRAPIRTPALRPAFLNPPVHLAAEAQRCRLRQWRCAARATNDSLLLLPH